MPQGSKRRAQAAEAAVMSVGSAGGVLSKLLYPQVEGGSPEASVHDGGYAQWQVDLLAVRLAVFASGLWTSMRRETPEARNR
ncbi:hypothetical protein C8R46DRAFT_1220577 [Mycena filopes]|nr:hypothetical protein C8R46DRAFT_1220577 [Mycena filopes]